ncbi:hypothetical protein L5I01_17595 [Gordonia sp. HY442]|uniref:hypothetical protein n=1 Tax=Gordonia zhenghanii TaxID=2911516 RepID=UPI001F3378C0|nr:hypothetical protein [Gordonia zhenghanii]MCF8605171.1 hypothetical protein [Gordonia zhenghanii]
MGIQASTITDAIAAGEVAAGNISSFHPVTAAGLSRWIEVVGNLRRGLAEGDWAPDNPLNRPISKRTDGIGYTLSTVGGNDATGIADHPTGPLAARKKGKSTAEAVNGTGALITVETLRGAPLRERSEAPPAGNWFLIYYRPAGSDEVRCEVSLPRAFDEQAGQFAGWQVRVILPKWEPQGTVVQPLDAGGQDVTFRVREIS